MRPAPFIFVWRFDSRARDSLARSNRPTMNSRLDRVRTASERVNQVANQNASTSRDDGAFGAGLTAQRAACGFLNARDNRVRDLLDVLGPHRPVDDKHKVTAHRRLVRLVGQGP